MTAPSVRTARGLEFLVYPCNLLGYFRLGLVAAAVMFWHASTQDTFTTNLIFVAILCASSLLDALDGYLARRLHHETQFGEVLDQSTDLLTSTVIWLASGSILAVPILILEWSTGLTTMARATLASPMPHLLCRHDRVRYPRLEDEKARSRPLGSRLHARLFGAQVVDGVHRFGSWLARPYFANRQRNALSVIANVSHFSYPVALILGPGFYWAAYVAVPGLVVFVTATMLILVTGHVVGASRTRSRRDSGAVG